MPSPHQRAAASKVPEHRSLEERFGENPARWIAGGRHMAVARARGVRDCELPDGITAVDYLRAMRALCRRYDAHHDVERTIERRLEDLEDG